MSGSQSLLAIGALTLLSTLTLTINRAIVSSFSTMLETQTMIAAVAEAENLLQTMQSKPFDQALATPPPSSGPPSGPPGKSKRLPPGIAKKPSDFTPPGLLGREAGERYPFFNDLDDYNGLTLSAWNPMYRDSLTLRVSVEYVDPKAPNQQASIQTNAKRIRLRVFMEGMTDTLKLQQIVYQ
ncbi:MAG TPA: hypothetical protein VNL36_00840 [Bacteroidota bacterium]|nr:hypothetical protein [Bacteroidota bacterium]